VPAPALRVLEYAFLALLYLFLLRVIRAVWVELREPAPASTAAGIAPEVPAKSKVRRRGPTRLVVAGGDGAEGQPPLLLGEEITIGRAPGCGLVISTDNFVSARHARVFRRGDQYWVEDLGSTNGTLLNGRRLDAVAPLRRGDRLQVGRTLLELQR
jgi:hypothetical protein